MILRVAPMIQFVCRPFLLALFACLVAQSCLHTELEAQEVRKALNDYRRDRVFQYQPSDPFVRSKMFQVQTKHYGWFYNCDNEECKRNSPYICWKPHYEKDFPTTMRAMQRIRHEVNQVKQRVLDGAGMCASGCTCQDCQGSELMPVQSGGCQHCGNASPTTMKLSDVQGYGVQRPLHERPGRERNVAVQQSRIMPKEGLIREGLIRSVDRDRAVAGTRQQKPVDRLSRGLTTDPRSAPKARTASQDDSLLGRLRSTNR